MQGPLVSNNMQMSAIESLIKLFFFTFIEHAFQVVGQNSIVFQYHVDINVFQVSSLLCKGQNGICCNDYGNANELHLRWLVSQHKAHEVYCLIIHQRLTALRTRPAFIIFTNLFASHPKKDCDSQNSFHWWKNARIIRQLSWITILSKKFLK